jgi:N-acetylmuramoyl-L-alanine amidase
VSRSHAIRITILITFLLLLSLPSLPIKAEPDQLGTVTISVGTLNVRADHHLDSPLVGKVHQGESYPILSIKNNWVQIPLDDNQKGWIASWLAEIQSSSALPGTYVTPTIDTINVRSGPSTSFSVVEQIKKGEKYVKQDEMGDWTKIKLPNGNVGWTANWLLSEETIENSPEVVSPRLHSTAKVNVPILNMRTGPDTSHGIAGKLSKGTSLQVLEQQNDWVKVSADGLTGWVAEWLVTYADRDSALPQASTKDKAQVKILNPGTNIRSGPATSHTVVHVANQGDIFEVIRSEGDWFRIRLINGKIGYVAGWIVAAEGIPNVKRKGIEQLLQGKTIVVDPGHGGTDSGAIGPHLGSLEKEVNLKVSKLLTNKLKSAGASVVLTRTDDRKITLQRRVDMAINEQADIFISVHHNTNENYRINGIITYFYSNGEDRGLASTIQKELVKRTGLGDLKARYGNFFVLRENPQLAVLCELGFLTNYQEEVILNTKVFQEQAAESIFQGIIRYYHEKQ